MGRHHQATAFCVLALLVLILWLGVQSGRAWQAIGYVAVVWISAFFIDLVVLMRPEPAIGFPLKGSVAWESFLCVGLTLAGIAPLAVRFSKEWPVHSGLEKVAFLTALSLFTFPVALALIFFAVYRYRPKDLGVNAHFWYLPFLLQIVVGGITLAAAPETSHWRSSIHAYGVWRFLLVGFGAAVPEEFTRMLLQTRLGASLHSKGLGLLAATFLWACTHVPQFRSQNPEASFWSAVLAALTILPIGLLWGYATYRTKSLWPAVVSHGLNLWGIQNF